MVLPNRIGMAELGRYGLRRSQHQALTAAGGASAPIRVINIRTIVRGNYRLRRQHRFVGAPIGKIQFLFSVVVGPFSGPHDRIVIRLTAGPVGPGQWR